MFGEIEDINLPAFVKVFVVENNPQGIADKKEVAS